MEGHVKTRTPTASKPDGPARAHPMRELAMLREVDAHPDVVPEGATARVEAYRNERLRWTKATAETAKGTLYRKPNGEPAVNPYLRQERDAARQMRTIERAIQQEMHDALSDVPRRGSTRTRRHEVARVEAQRILDRIPTRTFARLEAEGVIVPKRRGKPGVPSIYDLATIVPAYVQHLKGAKGSGNDRAARARRDATQAQLNELRLAREKGELLPRHQVIADGLAFIRASKAKILGLPRRLVQAGVLPPASQATAADLLNEALDEMSRWQTQIDLMAAAEERA
jgi:hypothetical protein